MLQGICPSESQTSLPREHWKWGAAFRSCQTWPLVYRSFYYISRFFPVWDCRSVLLWAVLAASTVFSGFALTFFVSAVRILGLCFSITGSKHWICQFPFLQPQHHIPTICQNQFLVWSLQPCVITWPAVLGDWYRCLTLVVSELTSLSLCHFVLFKVWSHPSLLLTPFLFYGKRTDPRIPHNDGLCCNIEEVSLHQYAYAKELNAFASV